MPTAPWNTPPDLDIIRPANPANGNGIQLFNILNRGNKGALSLFNADVPPGATGPNLLENAGDGWLQRQGYTVIWFGWQADVLPGDGRMTLQVPVARQSDGSAITGLVRAELVVQTAPATVLNLSSGWFTGMTHASAPYREHGQPDQACRRLPADPDGARDGERAAPSPSRTPSGASAAAPRRTTPRSAIPPGSSPGNFTS